MIKDLVIQNRSCRRFYQEVAIERETLEELIDLSRFCACGRNRQPLKYILSCDPERNAVIFPHLGFARRFPDQPYPPEGERPPAYIVILGDKEIRATFGCDHGIAAQSILLGARERGLGGCMVGLIKRDELSKTLDITSRYEILLVLALGKPKEKVVIDPVGPDGNCKAYFDSDGVRHVPKRSLEDIIIG